jgi:hypothetical protein
MIGGDLVTTGPNKSHWTDHFFPNMRPLIDSVPFYPVIGNHEQNSMHYYDYVKLPEPEYFYTFKQGDIQFFIIDSNKDLRPGSEQYRWLDRELAASTSLWKICMHHHPPFSSDDDYGNDWKHAVEEMTFGEPATKPIVALYDKHRVDIVLNGHIHSYERTWMIRHGKPVKRNGANSIHRRAVSRRACWKRVFSRRRKRTKKLPHSGCNSRCRPKPRRCFQSMAK